MTTLISGMLNLIHDTLEQELITNISVDDPARADIVKIGPLQGEPELEDAPISIEVYHSDPQNPEEWVDEIIEYEMPNTAIWKRKFTVLVRALLVESGASLSESLDIISDVMYRAESAIRHIDWGSVSTEIEYPMGCPADEIQSETEQGGGPGEYDWSGKIRFSVLTVAP